MSTEREKREKLLESVSPIMQLQAARNYAELHVAISRCLDDMMKKERADPKYDARSDMAVVLGMVNGCIRSLNDKRSEPSKLMISGALDDTVAVLVALQNMPEVLGAARIELEVKVVLVP